MSLEHAKVFIEKFFWDQSFRQRADPQINRSLQNKAARQAFLNHEGFSSSQKEIKELALTSGPNQFYSANGWIDFNHWLQGD